MVSLSSYQYFVLLTTSRSSFVLRVGNFPKVQNIRVLPSTNLPEIYLINTVGCGRVGQNTTYAVNLKPCPESRGTLYDNSSASYKPVGIYDMTSNNVIRKFRTEELEGQLGMEDIRFGYQQNGIETSPTANQTLIVELADQKLTWMGMLGLDSSGVNLSDFFPFEAPTKSWISQLKDASVIPSKSWAYTAGSVNGKNFNS